MRSSWAHFRFFALTGFSASMGLAADHFWHAGAFCPFNGSCAEVAASSYGNLLGIPLYVFGLAAFALLFGLTFVPNRRTPLMVRTAASVAGLAGIALLLIQFGILKHICGLCVVADASAILLALLAITRRLEPPILSRLQIAIWLVALFLAIGAPLFVVLANLHAPIPDQVREHVDARTRDARRGDGFRLPPMPTNGRDIETGSSRTRTTRSQAGRPDAGPRERMARRPGLFGGETAEQGRRNGGRLVRRQVAIRERMPADRRRSGSWISTNLIARWAIRPRERNCEQQSTGRRMRATDCP